MLQRLVGLFFAGFGLTWAYGLLSKYVGLPELSGGGAILIVLGLPVAYLLVTILVFLLSQRLLKSNPRLADRLSRLFGLLETSGSHYIARLGLNADDPVEADRLWREIEPRLANMPAGVRVALTTNYSSSLATRGLNSRARDLLLAHPSGITNPVFRDFYALYWLNLGWYHLQLGEKDEAATCLERARECSPAHLVVRDRQKTLRALLASENDDAEEVLNALRQDDAKSGLGALMLADLGLLEEARQRLPELQSLSTKAHRTNYHLARALIEKDRGQLELAAATGFGAGMVAYYALKHFHDPSYLARAREYDPESLWTRRLRDNQCSAT